MRSRVLAVVGLSITASVVCGGPAVADTSPPATAVESLQVVDCLLPGQIRRLGMRVTYLSARRPARLVASECAILGGEYVAYDRADYQTALNVWLPQAQEGDKKAQTYVGEIYEKGLGVPPDHAKAAEWYRRAAEQGDARAQVNLGHLYEKGLGVRQDPAAAVNWYGRASGLPQAIALDSGASPAPANEALAKQLREQQQQAQALSAQLAAAQAALARSEGEVKASRQELATAQARISEAAHAGSGEQAKLRALQQALDTRQAQLARQQQDITRLDGESARLRAQLAASEAARSASAPAVPADVPQAGPSIELIEPPLLASRGPLAVPAAADTERDLIGRVTAPAGLLTLSVNDRSTPPDAHGLFHASLRVGKERLPVRLVAVDRQGKRAELAFDLAPQMAAPPAPPLKSMMPPVNFGRFYALVIGIDEYRDAGMPRLKTAVADAREVAGLLTRHYGFEVRLLTNPTRYEIMSALHAFQQTLGDDDNFLIYYAGHGTLVEAGPVTRGQWQPADAEPDNPANWISSVDISDYLSILRAKQVLVVADSCYSGALTRSAVAREDANLSDAQRQHWLELMARKRSRTALTSGGLAPVLDAGSGNHSVFANALLDVLAANDEVLEAQRLYRQVSARVALAAERYRFEQVPEYAPIQLAGHEAGDFFFVPIHR